MFGLKQMQAKELRRLQDSKDRITLVDVRSPAETAKGVISGAKLVPLNLLSNHLDLLADSKRIVVYCHSGMRSAHAVSFLSKQGFQEVYNLRGGINAWLMQHYPLVKPL